MGNYRFDDDTAIQIVLADGGVPHARGKDDAGNNSGRQVGASMA
jgi:hypothetical protein